MSYTIHDAYPQTAERNYQSNPSIRPIYIVRESVTRQMPLYRQFQAFGRSVPYHFSRFSKRMSACWILPVAGSRFQGIDATFGTHRSRSCTSMTGRTIHKPC